MPVDAIPVKGAYTGIACLLRVAVVQCTLLQISASSSDPLASFQRNHLHWYTPLGDM